MLTCWLFLLHFLPSLQAYFEEEVAEPLEFFLSFISPLLIKPKNISFCFVGFSFMRVFTHSKYSEGKTTSLLTFHFLFPLIQPKVWGSMGFGWNVCEKDSPKGRGPLGEPCQRQKSLSWHFHTSPIPQGVLIKSIFCLLDPLLML